MLKWLTIADRRSVRTLNELGDLKGTAQFRRTSEDNRQAGRQAHQPASEIPNSYIPRFGLHLRSLAVGPTLFLVQDYRYLCHAFWQVATINVGYVVKMQRFWNLEHFRNFMHPAIRRTYKLHVLRSMWGSAIGFWLPTFLLILLQLDAKKLLLNAL